MSDSNHSDHSDYGYTPSLAPAVAFIVLFSVSAIVHSIQAFRSRYWIVYPTLVLGALVEILGWSARLWSHENVLLLTPFLMQISTLIIAPVFFSAFDYTLLGVAISRLGPQYSILRPTWYLAIFLVADTISLVIQAVGGGKASAAAAKGIPTASATDTMVAGIIIQMIAMAVFVGLAFDFIWRASLKKPYAFQERRLEKIIAKSVSDRGVGSVEKVGRDGRIGQGEESLRNWWILMAGVAISSVMILLRGIYRSIELKQGWSGHLMTTEIFSICLDAIPMVIAVAVFNFINPVFLLPRRPVWKGYH
ncbi:hypothetical protein M231_02986 [Tremella mesenterica]|uniref:RTA1 like protein n=1 Tax=Tremella mesenterica TaxID=5217 RepID=A0A4Q1BPJ0_TREME|nr:hypothetical protein M231_02986 [Tremella mesenterica]